MKHYVVKRWHGLLFALFAILAVGGMSFAKLAQASPVHLTPIPDRAEPEPVYSWLYNESTGQVLRNVIDPPFQESEIDIIATETVIDANAEKLRDEQVHKTEEDVKQIDCLIRNVLFESGGEPTIGQLWVLDVVRNRTLMQYRGNKTYCETVFDPKQFSWTNEDPDREPPLTADLLVITELVKAWYYDQNHKDRTCGATHYLRADWIWKTRWAQQAIDGTSPEGLTLLAVIGEHAFFGKQGCPSYERKK